MSDVVARDEWRTKKVRDWLLAILRFAVTLHDADRSAVLAVAEEIDKLGERPEGRSAFKFFRNTSIEICTAILEKQNSKGSAVLRLHLNRIDDCRLRRAFAAAIEIWRFFSDNQKRWQNQNTRWSRPMERTSATARRLSFQACTFATYVPFITTMIPPPRIPMRRSPTLPGKENSDGPAAFHPNLHIGHGSRTSPDVLW